MSKLFQMQVNVHHFDKNDRLLTSHQIHLIFVLKRSLHWFICIVYCHFNLVIGVKAQFFTRNFLLCVSQHLHTYTHTYTLFQLELSE